MDDQSDFEIKVGLLLDFVPTTHKCVVHLTAIGLEYFSYKCNFSSWTTLIR